MNVGWANVMLDPIELAQIYEWIDSIPFSQPKGKIEKDFADGVAVAELVRHYFPQLVDIKDYQHGKNIQERMSNWRLLNGKVFSRLGLNVPENVMSQLSRGKESHIEVFLYNLRETIRAAMLYRDHDLRFGKLDHLYADSYLYRGNGILPRVDPLLAPIDPLLLPLVAKRPIIVDPLLVKQTPHTPNALRKGASYAKSSTKPGVLPPIDKHHDSVSRLDMEEKAQEALIREEEIQALKIQLNRLEQIVNIKDSRIGELEKKIEDIQKKKTRGGSKN